MSDVKTRKRRNVVGIDMIRNKRVEKYFGATEQTNGLNMMTRTNRRMDSRLITALEIDLIYGV